MMTSPKKELSSSDKKKNNKIFLFIWILTLLGVWIYRDQYVVYGSDRKIAFKFVIDPIEDEVKRITKAIIYTSSKRCDVRAPGWCTGYEMYIDRTEWDDKRNQEYKDIFVKQAWTAINKDETEFCKGGVLAKLERNAGVYLKQEAGLISMDIQKEGRGICWDGDKPR